MKKLNKVIIIISLFIALFGVVFLLYINDYYRASSDVNNILESGNIDISKDKNMIIFKSKEKSDIGLVFYPGGKVDYKAYIPLMESLSLKGINSILISMPFNLAVFDKDAAEMAFKELPNINKWYVGGHSLGGAMASDFVRESNNELIKGLILLGAYPVEDINIPNIIIYGSEDLVLSKEKLDNSSNTVEIRGGNHGYFGNYGEQKGDGKASISRAQQQKITLDTILDFIEEQK